MHDDAYLEAQVMTAKPHQLHLMVVDGAMRFAAKAEEALRADDFDTAHFALNKSRGCIGELIAGLNPDHAPEMVERLKALFVFVYRNLADADMSRDASRVATALHVLRIHRETWVALGEQLGRDAQTGAPAGGRHWMT